MITAASVRKALPGGDFREPVSASMLLEAETSLGHALPPLLRELYLAFDGFLGPTLAPFLFPLVTRPSEMQESLVSFTLFLRSEDYCPDWLHRAVAVGGSGGGAAWFILLERPDAVVRWEAEWGPEFEELDGSLLEVWLREKAKYEPLRGDA